MSIEFDYASMGLGMARGTRPALWKKWGCTARGKNAFLWRGLPILSWKHWLLRKAGGLDGLASSSSHYTCEKLLAASRPIPARRDWRLLGATSARFEQALWGEYLPEPPESTPTPHRSPSQGLAEDTVAGAQHACVPQITRSWCWPRRALKC